MTITGTCRISATLTIFAAVLITPRKFGIRSPAYQTIEHIEVVRWSSIVRASRLGPVR